MSESSTNQQSGSRSSSRWRHTSYAQIIEERIEQEPSIRLYADTSSDGLPIYTIKYTMYRIKIIRIVPVYTLESVANQ